MYGEKFKLLEPITGEKNARKGAKAQRTIAYCLLTTAYCLLPQAPLPSLHILKEPFPSNEILSGRNWCRYWPARWNPPASSPALSCGGVAVLLTKATSCAAVEPHEVRRHIDCVPAMGCDPW